MSEEKLNADDRDTENGVAYQPPAIEEVVSREGLEREVAYAGLIGQSQLVN
jgi:hypothetical protein